MGWPEFTAARAGALAALAEPVRAGTARADTQHPVFHGCVDWHSAVHATYALLAAGRLTGRQDLIDAALAPARDAAQVRAEEAALRDGHLPEEIPYGTAWVLILDREAARGGLSTFRGLAELAHDRIIGYLEHLAATRTLTAAVADQEYSNALWAAIALLRWTTAVRPAARTRAERFARTTLRAALTGPVTTVDPPVGFLWPPHLALLLAADLGLTAGDAATRDTAAGDLTPLLDVAAATRPLPAGAMTTVHSAGLNFSRAWGMYAAWRITGAEAYRDRFADLFFGHLAVPDRWREDHRRYGHWVPQFGIFAVAETFDHGTRE